MPKSCAARQCCNRYSNRRKQLTFHRFPFSRPELLKEWVLNIGRGNFQPKQHTVICSEHFRPECFSAFGNRKNLKHNAVPTEFAFQDARQVSYTPTGPNIGHCPQQLPVSQLLREDTDTAGKGGHADSEKEKVFPEAEAREHGPERKTDTALEGLQRPPSARDPAGQENEKLRKRLKAQRLVMRRLCRRLRAHGAGRPGPRAGPRPEQQS
ncbi:THAP domain-containing protein 3 isoform X6 [Myotis daubentonii]|uniref:THAP domain-containing protein 3 isoform X6 n=1 Tax=Myotis daubentonii TaxID=98922 RepID=UPI00287340EB|nr:THAP domain-containing protein 3 isoform X6 [Myotis daubentonii]